MLPVDTRWKQRLESYERALGLLSSALKGGPDVLNDLEKEGTIRRFEFTLELGWKVLKDYLEFSGAQLTSVTPKSVVKAAFSARLLDDGQLWVDMLMWRNQLSHQYEESLRDAGLRHINDRFLPALQRLGDRLRHTETEVEGDDTVDPKRDREQ